MNTVFILGAGASRQAGAPLMFDFLDKAERLIRLSNRPIDKAAFTDVFAAISELQGIYAKSHLELSNIETLFGAIEIAQMIGKFADRGPESIHKLRESMITLIVQTLEQSLLFPVEREYLVAPRPYDAFIDSLESLYESFHRFSSADVSFITFNYDIALDVALFRTRSHYDYWLEEKVEGQAKMRIRQQGYALLKLHGSINWGTCQTCGEIIPVSLGNYLNLDLRGRELSNLPLAIGTSIDKNQHCKLPLQSPPVLVPPTWNKTSYNNNLARVWKKAAEVLNDAQNIFVIGYSLPETDSFFRYLFALGTDSPTRINRIAVFDPDPSEQVEQRFRAMIGRGAENRFIFQRLNFDSAISEIVEMLRLDLS